MADLDRSVGRTAFGGDPAGYHAARPAYPDWVFDLLRERCGLGPGRAVFEVGPGTGTATSQLLMLGAAPLVAIEPDARLADHLRRTIPSGDLEVRIEAFEDTQLADGTFDLGVAATSFHWVRAEPGLAQAGRLLRPGGWWSMVWNVFGDEARQDDFHEATAEVLGDRRSPSAGSGGRPDYGLDQARRRAELEASGLFQDVGFEVRPWTLILDAAGVRALYGTYSEINARTADERERVLDALVEIAERQFGGRVERNMLTALHTACRR
jgi:SAM-dependent methyltransferase